MKLSEAKICLNCDEIHEGYNCPKCGIGPSYSIVGRGWINPLYLKGLRDNYRKAQEELAMEVVHYDHA